MISQAQVITAVESIRLPGIQSLVGIRLTQRLTRSLRFYFSELFREVRLVNLEVIFTRFIPDQSIDVHPSVIDDAINMTRQTIEPTIQKLDAELRQAILPILRSGYALAEAQFSHEQEPRFVQEQDEFEGPVNPLAIAFANEQSALLIQGLNRTSKKRISGAIARGLKDRLGVPGTARELRRVMNSMTRVRSKVIARTEMNRAMSNATFNQMGERGVIKKTIVLAPNPDQICITNKNAGSILRSDNFPSGQAYPPFHPN